LGSKYRFDHVSDVIPAQAGIQWTIKIYSLLSRLSIAGFPFSWE